MISRDILGYRVPYESLLVDHRSYHIGMFRGSEVRLRSRCVVMTYNCSGYSVLVDVTAEPQRMGYPYEGSRSPDGRRAGHTSSRDLHRATRLLHQLSRHIP